MWRYPLVMVAIALMGCQEGSGFPPEQEQVDPTLTDIQAKVFNLSCALSRCHDTISKKGGLDLTDGISFSALVNIEARQSGARSDGKLRVIPNDPANSYLLQKITEVESGEGFFMPLGNREISPAAIEAIELWIAGGALDN
jgi:hypothetical protein